MPVSDRRRLRAAHDAAELAKIYAEPHDHTQWEDHQVRVAVTAAFAAKVAGRVQRAADLSCGDGAILAAVDAAERFFGDLAPGWPITGPVEQTIEQIPPVDAFVCCETIEHLDNPDVVVKAIRGRARGLVLSTPVGAWHDRNPEHYWAWDRGAVEDMLTDSGFTAVAYCELDFPDVVGGYRFGLWWCR